MDVLASTLDEEESIAYQLETRNKRWFTILCSNLTQSKLIAVGLNHVPGLYQLYIDNGFQVERVDLAKINNIEKVE